MLKVKEISAPDDKKSRDWVDDAMTGDPEDKRRDDWTDEKHVVGSETKKIVNPEYEDDDVVYKYGDFGFLGFDLWQVKGFTNLDDIVVADDQSEADALVEKWKVLSEIEQDKKKAEDAGIQTLEDSKFFGISAGFDSFSDEGNELIVQYMMVLIVLKVEH